MRSCLKDTSSFCFLCVTRNNSERQGESLQSCEAYINKDHRDILLLSGRNIWNKNQFYHIIHYEKFCCIIKCFFVLIVLQYSTPHGVCALISLWGCIQSSVRELSLQSLVILAWKSPFVVEYLFKQYPCFQHHISSQHLSAIWCNNPLSGI